jgi:polyhydroxybutyrate depolymerase
MSNGAMMAYRLAVEVPERFAAIAPVAGTMVVEDPKITHPMPVLHIHGTKDALVPFEGSKNRGFRFPPVEASLKPWIAVDQCDPTPVVTELPTKRDKRRVVRKAWSDCKTDAEVILYVVEGGGHTWPGMSLHAQFLGETTYNLIANDVIWAFFQKHARK